MDIERIPDLLNYLRNIGRIEPDEVPQFRLLSGGVSNRTVLVARPTGESWILKQALERLRVADEWFSPPGRILCEAAGMCALRKLAPRGSITRLLFTDPVNYLLAMECVPEPNDKWKTILLSGRVEQAHFEQFANLMVSIHCGGATQEFREKFQNRSFFESLRIEPFYLATAARVTPAQSFLKALAEGTRGQRVTLVHGDSSPKNILIHEGQLVLLDHEVIHFGDPAFDIGFAMAHFLSKAHHLKHSRRVLAEATEYYWRVYSQAGGLAEEKTSIRHALACLLARVAGRSRLEYLNLDEQRRQSIAVISLLGNLPRSVPELTERFLESV